MNCWLYPRAGNPLELTGVERGGTQEKRVWCVHGRGGRQDGGAGPEGSRHRLSRSSPLTPRSEGTFHSATRSLPRQGGEVGIQNNAC